MKKTKIALTVFIILFLVACNQSDERHVYEDVKFNLTKELEEKGYNDIELSNQENTDIKELDEDTYLASGKLFDNNETLIATFNMELQYNDDQVAYQWETTGIDSEAKEELESETDLTPLDILNQLATLSKDTEEIYIKEDIIVGEDEVKPGIYDMEITGGTGNLMGKHAHLPYLSLNWAIGAEGNSGGYPSQIRIILFEEDTLKFKDISKIKLNAVPEDVNASNEIGIGEFIVGRDISPGDYKLETNVNMNPDYDNLGWDITIYNDETGKSRDQTLTATNDDVRITLKEGEIISTSYQNTDHGSSSDNAKLIFEEEY